MLMVRVSSCVFASLVSLLLTMLITVQSVGQSTNLSPVQTTLLNLLHQQQSEHAPPQRIGYLWAQLASAYHETGNITDALDAYQHALPLLAKDPSSQSNLATTLDNMGDLYLQTGEIAQAEDVRKKAFKIRTTIGRPVDLARSHEHLAEVLLAQHRFSQAEEHAQQANEILTAQKEESSVKFAAGTPLVTYNQPGNTRLSALVTLVYAQCMQGKTQACMSNAQEADSVAHRDFATNSNEVAHADLALGIAQWKSGAIHDAEESMQAGIALLKTNLGEANPIALEAMMEYRDFLKAQHRKAEASSIELAVKNTAIPHGCASCTVSVYTLH